MKKHIWVWRREEVTKLPYKEIKIEVSNYSRNDKSQNRIDEEHTSWSLNFLFVNKAWPQCDFIFPRTPSSMLKEDHRVVWIHTRMHIQHWRGGQRVSSITSILISFYRRQRSFLLYFLRCRHDELWWVQQSLQRQNWLKSNIDNTLSWHCMHYPAYPLDSSLTASCAPHLASQAPPNLP